MRRTCVTDLARFLGGFGRGLLDRLLRLADRLDHRLPRLLDRFPHRLAVGTRRQLDLDADVAERDRGIRGARPTPPMPPPEAGPLLPAAGARPPRGEIRTPFLSIEMVTSRPSVSFFSMTMAAGSLLAAGLGRLRRLGRRGGVTVTCSVEPIGRLNGGSFDRISALIRSSTESSAKRIQVMPTSQLP